MKGLESFNSYVLGEPTHIGGGADAFSPHLLHDMYWACVPKPFSDVQQNKGAAEEPWVGNQKPY